jgi:hypothetical protein
MAGLSWAIWLAAPAVVTLLAALVLWWRARPEPRLRTAQTISGHRAYLEALAPAVDQRAEAVASEVHNQPG